MGFELTTLVVIGTDCTGRCKSNYHKIMTMMAPWITNDYSGIHVSNYTVNSLPSCHSNFFLIDCLAFQSCSDITHYSVMSMYFI